MTKSRRLIVHLACNRDPAVKAIDSLFPAMPVGAARRGLTDVTSVTSRSGRVIGNDLLSNGSHFLLIENRN